MKLQFICVVGLLIFLILPLSAVAQLSDIEQASADARSDAKQNVSPFAWGAYGFACSIVALPHAFLGTPEVPFERLIGKSPDYVNTYTRVYQQSAKRRRLQSAAIGCGLGVGVSTFTNLILLPQLSE